MITKIEVTVFCLSLGGHSAPIAMWSLLTSSVPHFFLSLEESHLQHHWGRYWCLFLIWIWEKASRSGKRLEALMSSWDYSNGMSWIMGISRLQRRQMHRGGKTRWSNLLLFAEISCIRRFPWNWGASFVSAYFPQSWPPPAQGKKRMHLSVQCQRKHKGETYRTKQIQHRDPVWNAGTLGPLLCCLCERGFPRK